MRIAIPLKISLTSVALVMAPVSAMAQDMMKPEVPPAPSSSPPSTAAPMDSPSAPLPAAPAPSVAEKVAADWSKYDMGAKGHLTKGELGRWLGDLRASNGEPAPDAQWLDAAFIQTDGNKDKKVSKEELTTSLSGGK